MHPREITKNKATRLKAAGLCASGVVLFMGNPRPEANDCNVAPTGNRECASTRCSGEAYDEMRNNVFRRSPDDPAMADQRTRPESGNIFTATGGIIPGSVEFFDSGMHRIYPPGECDQGSRRDNRTPSLENLPTPWRAPLPGIDQRSAEPSVDDPRRGRVDPRTDPRMDPRIDPRTEPRIDQRTEPRIDQRTEPRFDPRTEPRFERPPIDQRDDAPRPANVYEMRGLNHRSGNHSSPDAMVVVPAGYDPNRPTRVLIYNHGLRTNTSGALRDSELQTQMAAADPNTILIIPEWQSQPGTNDNGRSSRFMQPNFFRDQLQEIMERTPELRGMNVNDISSFGVITHSGGFHAASTELYKNGLGNRVTDVTVLDSMYDPTAYDGWIRDNLQDLAAGRRHFQVIYTDHLASQTNGLASRVNGWLAQAGLSNQSVYRDNRGDSNLVDPSTIASHGFVFKHSAYNPRGEGAHGSMTHVYLRQLLQSERQQQSR